MYRQYHSIHTSSPQNQSLQLDSSHLDERIRKIKRKYGNQSQKFNNNRQYIQSKLNYSVCEQIEFPNTSKLTKCNEKLAKSIIDRDYSNVDKENSMMGLNCSSINQEDIVEKRVHKRVKQNQRIQQLEEINEKIGKLIQCLKVDQMQNQLLKTHNQSACSTQTIKQQSISTLQATKISERNVKSLKTQPALHISLLDKRQLKLKNPSQNNYQSLRTYKSVESRQSSSRIGKISVKNEREAGKLSRIKNATKSNKILRNNEEVLFQQSVNQKQRKTLIKELCKQIILDSQFMKQKTRLIRNGLNAKQLLQSAIQTGNWTEEQKQIILEWNFQDIDPLFTQRCYNTVKIENTNQMVYETIDCFIKCQDNWKRRIYKKFSSDKINLHDLDGEKGYFMKQDLARFLSIENKSMYCNRDINIIFRRLNTKKNKIVSMKDLFNIICS